MSTGTSVMAMSVAADHGEGLRERQRMEELAFLPGQQRTPG